MTELAVPSVVNVVGPQKATVRWEGGPDPLYRCLPLCEVNKRKQKAMVFHWFIHSFLKWPAKQFVTQVFAIVFATVFVPICLSTIPFLSLGATAQEWTLLKSLRKVLLNLSSNCDNSAAKKSNNHTTGKQLGRCSRVYKWGFRASGLNKVLFSQRTEKRTSRRWKSLLEAAASSIFDKCSMVSCPGMYLPQVPLPYARCRMSWATSWG